MPRLPFIGSGNTLQGNGELAVRKQDFVSHAEGGGFRHTADQIDMNPPLSVAPNYRTVQQTLEKIESYIFGREYITIGDGVDSTGDYTVGSTDTPTVNDCITAAVASGKLNKGGWLYFKPGVFNFDTSVTLPMGVSIIGSAESSILNVTPTLGATGLPLFTVPASFDIQFGEKLTAPAEQYRSDGYGVTRFVNVTFTDNFGASYIPGLTTPNSCFIKMLQDSKVSIEDCVVLGRAKHGATSATALASNAFVIYAPASAATYGSTLSIKDCVIHGVKQVVKFLGDQTKSNFFEFRNNRVWCFNTSDATKWYLNHVNACPTHVTGNSFKFSNINGANSTVLSVCFKFSGVAASLVNIVVQSNTLVDSPDNINHKNQLFEIDSTAVGNMIRWNVSGNICGNISDMNSWYLVVGDGVYSIGDLNGRDVLNAVSNYSLQFQTHMSELDGTADQMTLFIRPGQYVINNTFHECGLGTKLIGLMEGGYLPQISFDNPTDAASASGVTLDTSMVNVALGNHIENLNFYSRDPVRIVGYLATKNFLNQEYFQDYYLIKNCWFKNVGIYPCTLTDENYLTSEYQNKVKIENCRFASNGSVAATKMHAILINKSKALFEFRNIIFERGTSAWYGSFLSERDSDGDVYTPTIVIDNCDLYTAGATLHTTDVTDTDFISIPRCKSLSITNSNIDASAVQSLVSVINVSAVADSVNISDCKIVGANLAIENDGGASTAISVVTDACPLIKIHNNHISNAPVGILVRMENTSANAMSSNISINGNIGVFGSKSTSFAQIKWGQNPNDDIRVTNITNNQIDCSSINVGDALIYQGVAAIDAVINVYAFGDYVTNTITNITNNIIFGGQTHQNFAAQAMISSRNCRKTYINGNQIRMLRETDVDGYTISCMSHNGSAYTVDEHSLAVIKDNSIRLTNSLELSSKIMIPINCRNINFVDVQGNTIDTANTYLTHYIAANAPVAYPAPIDGLVVNNIFSKPLAFEITYTTLNGNTLRFGEEPTSTREVLITYGNGTYDSRIRAENNKNQKAIIDINCTEFKQYGFNMLSAVDDNTPSRILQPAALMLKNTFAAAHSTNLTKTMQRMIDVAGLVPGEGEIGWSELPDGLYYTNVWRDGYEGGDPQLEYLDGGILKGHYQHQIIIPMSNLPVGCQLANIDIPIYFKNKHNAPVTVSVSASWIFGNDRIRLGLTDGYQYIDDPSLAGEVWRLTTTTLDTGEETMVLMNNQLLQNNGTFTVTKIANDSWGPSSSTRVIPRPNSYILLAIARTSPVPSTEKTLGFAIPFARLTVLY